jgi:heme exporter protein B
MKLSTDLVAGQPISGDLMVWLKLLVGFDIIFTALSLVLMDTVLVG